MGGKSREHCRLSNLTVVSPVVHTTPSHTGLQPHTHQHHQNTSLHSVNDTSHITGKETDYSEEGRVNNKFAQETVAK